MMFDIANIKPEEWDHDIHVFVCAHFCVHSDDLFEALRKTKCFIIHFGAERGYTSAQCSRKYHETITCFWVERIWNIISKNNIQNFSDFEVYFQTHRSLFEKTEIDSVYSPESLRSFKAKAKWVEPDIQ